MRSESDSTNTNRLNWDDMVKHEHPNILLRLYGNVMAAIGSFFIRLAMPFMTTFELSIDWDEEEEDLEDDSL